MTELTISAIEITEALRKHVTDFNPAVAAEQVGRVVEVGDGIARVSGLPSAKVNELLEFEDMDELFEGKSEDDRPMAFEVADGEPTPFDRFSNLEDRERIAGALLELDTLHR